MPTRNSSAREQVLELLKTDHKHVKKHFREFEKMDPEQDPQACQELVMRVCDELEVHAQIEEELFYPAARQALAEKEGEDLIDEAEVEHNSVKQLIAELRSLTPQDAKFKANFTVLSEYVKHHVKEEEGEMFEQLGRAKIAWEPLLQDMLDRQQELKSEKGLTEATEPDVQEAMHATRGKAGKSSASPRSAR
ncbi:hemerythrin domain-containing protein [Ideonella sp. BN130291]|uniref:hemerythrin domain-containing protein n=1 Tax=Ideonella sp. BN130291 TaxID=3112940 RepID=UPI002E257516|nr:hemerythrin domain-containing protein [Ideonella sp. BN130291]